MLIEIAKCSPFPATITRHGTEYSRLFSITLAIESAKTKAGDQPFFITIDFGDGSKRVTRCAGINGALSVYEAERHHYEAMNAEDRDYMAIPIRDLFNLMDTPAVELMRLHHNCGAIIDACYARREEMASYRTRRAAGII